MSIDAKIISAGTNGSESADVYFECDLGKFRLTISHSLLIEISIEHGEDWAGPVYEWGRSGAYVGPQVEEAFANVKGVAK